MLVHCSFPRSLCITNIKIPLLTLTQTSYCMCTHAYPLNCTINTYHYESGFSVEWHTQIITNTHWMYSSAACKCASLFSLDDDANDSGGVHESWLGLSACCCRSVMKVWGDMRTQTQACARRKRTQSCTENKGARGKRMEHIFLLEWHR